MNEPSRNFYQNGNSDQNKHSMQNNMDVQRQRERLREVKLDSTFKSDVVTLDPQLMIDSLLQANISHNNQIHNDHQLSNLAICRESVIPNDNAGKTHYMSVFSDESSIPEMYNRAFRLCGGTGDCLLDTSSVCNLMITSNLPRQTLGLIWSLVNHSLPGQLTKIEFFACLAYIALAQNQQPLNDISLSRLVPLPLPRLTLPRFPPPISCIASTISSASSYTISTAPLNSDDEWGEFNRSDEGDKYAALKHLHVNETTDEHEAIVPDSSESLSMGSGHTEEVATDSFDLAALSSGFDTGDDFVFNERPCSDDHLTVWMQCLQACDQLFLSCEQLLSQTSSSSVCRQVLSTDRGRNYLQSLSTVHGITTRIRFCLTTTAYQIDKRIVKLLTSIDGHWDMLLVYAVGFEYLVKIAEFQQVAIHLSQFSCRPRPKTNWHWLLSLTNPIKPAVYVYYTLIGCIPAEMSSISYTTDGPITLLVPICGQIVSAVHFHV